MTNSGPGPPTSELPLQNPRIWLDLLIPAKCLLPPVAHPVRFVKLQNTLFNWSLLLESSSDIVLDYTMYPSGGGDCVRFARALYRATCRRVVVRRESLSVSKGEVLEPNPRLQAVSSSSTRFQLSVKRHTFLLTTGYSLFPLRAPSNLVNAEISESQRRLDLVLQLEKSQRVDFLGYVVFPPTFWYVAILSAGSVLINFLIGAAHSSLVVAPSCRCR